MPIEMCSIGGFSEVGKNSTAIRVDNEVIILDMGLHMENYIRYTEDEDLSLWNYDELLRLNIVPNYRFIQEWKDMVKVIVPSHGHLDHIGAIPYAASLFPQAPIVATPYTAEVIRSIVSDDKIPLSQDVISIPLNGKYKVSKNITIEFVAITHSILHASLLVIHTPYGKIVYANDYKLDMNPVLGPKPNIARIQQVGKEGVIAAVVESLYASEHTKTPSEGVAKQMLHDTLFGMQMKDNLLICTTFSSHIARLKSIVECGEQLGRQVIFIGRSLYKYIGAAERLGLVNLTTKAKMVRHADKIDRLLKKINEKNRGKYMLVVTGHQGEPKAVLSRLIRNEFSFRFSQNDVVVFSCSVIPAELNKDNRSKLESALKGQGVRLCTDIHVSGHASREDHRELLMMLKPQHLLPSHAGYDKAHHLAELAYEMGMKKENVHLMEDGKRITL